MTFANDISSMMDAWDVILEAIRSEFPGASDDEQYAMARDALQAALGLTA